MQNADRWVLKELAELKFRPYTDVLPRLAANFEQFRALETTFREEIGNRLTKRQAVLMGLLARSFQLSISCLLNQLHQNHSGWNCSYRSLIETFFVADWLLQDPQRLEAYFESHAPPIGRIKTDCCRRHPQFLELYDVASQATHVETLALLLPRARTLAGPDDLPFTATEMGIAGRVLAENLVLIDAVQALLASRLQSLMALGEKLNTGEVLWERGVTKAKFGCLAYEPRKPGDGEAGCCGAEISDDEG